LDLVGLANEDYKWGVAAYIDIICKALGEVTHPLKLGMSLRVGQEHSTIDQQNNAIRALQKSERLGVTGAQHEIISPFPWEIGQKEVESPAFRIRFANRKVQETRLSRI
jgi:hypothetical protein